MRKTLIVLAGLALVSARDTPPVKPFVPVLTADFPDAFILPSGGEFLGYATNAQGGKANVQMARSVDLVRWELVRDGSKLHDAMPVPPPWAREGFTWAPEVIRTKTGYVFHFTAKDRRSELQCLGTPPLPPVRSGRSNRLRRSRWSVTSLSD